MKSSNLLPPEKIRTLSQLYQQINENERVLVDILRQLTQEVLQNYGKEKISFGVPYFCSNKGICIIWPASVPRGGIKKGVLFGFWYGNRLQDPSQYLTHGTNKQIFYKIFQSPEEIRIRPLKALLKEAIELDRSWKK